MPLSCEAVLPRRRVLALSAMAAAPLCGCGPQHALPEPGRAELAAAQRAIAVADPLRREGRTEAEAAAMLARVGGRLLASADPMCWGYLGEPCRFRIGMTRAPEVNAFAAEGGTVAVTTGLLEVAENDAELAAVVAHEMGHHLARHPGRAGARMRLGAIAGGLIGGYLGGPLLGEAAAQLAGGAARLAYSQAEEREADYLAAFLVNRAGYDLVQAGQIWIRLTQAAAGAERPGLLRTHPTGPERLAAWQRTVAEIRAAPGNPMPRRA